MPTDGGSRLVRLKLRSNVGTDIYVGNVNGKNFKCRVRIQPLVQHRLADVVRVLQHVLVFLGRHEEQEEEIRDRWQPSAPPG